MRSHARRNDLPHYAAWKVETVLAPPTVELVTDEVVEGGRRLKLLLKPGKNQHRVVVGAEPDFGSEMTINGLPVETPPNAIALDFSETTEAEIELTTAGKITLHVTGIDYGLPPSAESLLRARPGWASPGGGGDHGQVSTQFQCDLIGRSASVLGQFDLAEPPR